jgi:hypothetical protein
MLYFIMGLIAIPLIIGAVARIGYEIMSFCFNPVVVMTVLLVGYFYIKSLG